MCTTGAAQVVSSAKGIQRGERDHFQKGARLEKCNDPFLPHSGVGLKRTWALLILQLLCQCYLFFVLGPVIRRKHLDLDSELFIEPVAQLFLLPCPHL